MSTMKTQITDLENTFQPMLLRAHTSQIAKPIENPIEKVKQEKSTNNL